MSLADSNDGGASLTCPLARHAGSLGPVDGDGVLIPTVVARPIGQNNNLIEEQEPSPTAITRQNPLTLQREDSFVDGDGVLSPTVVARPIGRAGRPSHARRTLGVVTVAALCWLNVSGGPLGTEPIVSSCGPGIGFLGILVFPVVWSVPQAIVTAEMSAAFPDNGGYSLWVRSAFGEFWAVQESYWSWASGVVDNAVYPVLFYSTVSDLVQGSVAAGASDDDDEAFRCGTGGCLWAWALKAAVAVLFTLPNFLRVDKVGRGLVVLSVLVVLPFCVMCALALPEARPRTLLEVEPACLPDGVGAPWLPGTGARMGENPASVSSAPGAVDWSRVNRLVQALYWNMSGWQCVSTCAGEVKDPARTYRRALALAMVVTLSTYLVALAAAVAASGPGGWRGWSAGSFSVVAERVAAAAGVGGDGRWLGLWMVAASALSNWGQFGSELMEDSYQLLGMAEAGLAPAWLARRRSDSRGRADGAPWRAVALQLLIIVALLGLDFERILCVENFFSCASALLAMAAAAKVRLRADAQSTDARSTDARSTDAALAGSVVLPTNVLLAALVAPCFVGAGVLASSLLSYGAFSVGCIGVGLLLGVFPYALHAAGGALARAGRRGGDGGAGRGTHDGGGGHKEG
jgi:amino acid transporter